ncbi:MAG: cysteine desulfurase [Lachnospiraceae bacterium]|nr:cysteine desulfurase [Lachnospiraceae bacterium]
MEVYFDNAATTRCLPEAAKRMYEVLTEDYGNPSSLHRKGMEAENYMKEARRIIAKSLKVSEKEILFTSGGTESNNLAIFGAARARSRRGRHIVSTMIEHPSVYNPIAALQEEGFSVSLLPTDACGIVALEQLESSLTEDTILVSVMHVNNEIGSVEPIEEIARLVHEKAPKAVFHVDAVQSYGKLPVYPSRMGIDLLSVSGHKLNGPKGSGFLYVKEGVHLLPVNYGGGQERSLRSGTENVPAIAGLGLAVKKHFEKGTREAAELYALRKGFIRRLQEIPGVSLNGTADSALSAPHITNISVEGIRSEVLLHALEDRGIYVSSGSACSSNKPARSRTLLSIGATEEAMDTTIRFSFSFATTQEEVDYTVEALQELIPVLSKFQRR